MTFCLWQQIKISIFSIYSLNFPIANPYVFSISSTVMVILLCHNNSISAFSTTRSQNYFIRALLQCLIFLCDSTLFKFRTIMFVTHAIKMVLKSLHKLILHLHMFFDVSLDYIKLLKLYFLRVKG